MATEFEKLIVEIEARTNKFEKALSRVEGATGRTERRVKRSFRSMDRQVKDLTRTAGGLARAFLAVAGTQQVGQIFGDVSKIQDVADKVGLTTDQLQEYRFVAEQAGVQQNQLDMGMQRFSRRVAEAAAGAGELLPILKANNIELRKSDGTLRDQNDILRDYIGLIAGATSEQDQLLLAFKAFDSEGAALVNAFENGTEAVDGAIKKYRELGGVIDNDVIGSAKRLDDQWNALTRSIGDKIKSGVIKAVEWLEWLDAKIELAVTKAAKFTRELFGADTSDLDKRIAAAQERLQPPPADAGTVYGNGGRRATVIPNRGQQKKQVDEHESVQKALSDSVKRHIDRRIADMERLKQKQEEFNRSLMALGELGVDAFERLAFGGEKFSTVLKDMARNLAMAAIRATLLGQGPLAGLFGTSPAGGMAGGLLASILPRAAGGAVSRNQTYLVGERGPELFRPASAGRIEPNRTLGGSGMNVSVEVINESGHAVTARPGPSQQRGNQLFQKIYLQESMQAAAAQGMKRVAPAYGLAPIRTGR
jgi:hypothetical protein